MFVLLFCSNSLFAQLRYTNPILAGFYPDPSICRVGNDYYIVNSSFAYFPGLPVFHSTDLVNWEQLGNAMNRNAQLPLDDTRISRGLFAPTIRYHQGLYYIICTNVTQGGNFIITAKDPKGPWSDPVYLPEVDGIDPSLFFDKGDKAYIVYNSIPPDNNPLYEGHRTIRIIAYNIKEQKTVGDNKILVNGGTDISKHPVWIEAPHLYKRNGWYYLMCAQGGTGYNHSEVIFRSKKADGPFIAYENNPILTQRDLDTTRDHPITSTGHADLVETPGGKWYAVFLGCRPYKGDYYNTGRETFMAPVSWKNGWPVIIPHGEEVKYQYPVPFSSTKGVKDKFSGNYRFVDDFSTGKLNDRFIFLRNPSKNLYSIKNGALVLPLKKITLGEKKNAAFIGFRQAHLEGYASVKISFNPVSGNEKAGLVIYQNDQFYYFLCKSVKKGKPIVELYQSAGRKHEKEKLLATAELKNNDTLRLKIKADGDFYSFYYSVGGHWKLLKDRVDGTYLSTKNAGGFVGCVFAMYATSEGTKSENAARYDWFKYQGEDGVFKQLD